MRRTVTALWLSLPLLAHAAEWDCVPQTQLDVAKIDKQIVLIGEAHGTTEIPAFTAGLVCSLLRAGRSVILGIEHSGEEQAELNRYLRSTGTVDDRRALIQSSKNWSMYSDGRGSVAMLELVDLLRRWKVQGQRASVIALNKVETFDVPLLDDEKGHVPPAANALLNRIGNQVMADSVLSAVALYPNYTVVVLAGYSHTSTVPESSKNPMIGTYRPMGQIVNEQSPVFTIGIEVAGGELASGGKTYPVEARSLYVPATHVDAEVSVGRVSPSPPARDTIKP